MAAWASSGTSLEPAFPLDAADLIDGVRVAFYGFDCPKGMTVPKNGSGQLPVGCAGYVTATPKTKDNKDVDPRVHGSDIQWIHWEGHEQVKVEDFPGVPFNKIVDGVQEGGFRLCAVVKGVEVFRSPPTVKVVAAQPAAAALPNTGVAASSELLGLVGLSLLATGVVTMRLRRRQQA